MTKTGRIEVELGLGIRRGRGGVPEGNLGVGVRKRRLKDWRQEGSGQDCGGMSCWEV